MTNITNKFAFLACLLLLVVSAFAASEAEYGKMSKSYTLNADGSQEFRCSQELTLFTHTAMNGTYGESFIVYNPQFQELKIHASYTKQKDGTIIKTPDNAYVEVLPRFAADAPAFNNLKEMVVVHTGLELGATIYLDYSVLTKPGYYTELDVKDVLQETSPIKEYSIRISVPENKPLNWQFYGLSVKPSEVKNNGVKEVSCTLKNVPAACFEMFQSQNRDNVPCLVASTFASQKEALAFLDKQFKDSKDMECCSFAQYITENAANEQEKISIIQNHLVNNLSTSAVPLKSTGYTVRNADDVLRSAYGTKAEKTQLLNTMLNAAGITAEVLATYPGTLSSEACGLEPLKELTVKVSTNGKDQYLSANSLTPVVIASRGGLDKYLTLAGKEIAIAAIPTEIREKKEVSVDASKAVNGFVVCKLPTSASGVDSWYMNSLNSNRSTLFELPQMIDEEITYTVSPAEGLKLQTPVTTISISKPFGKVSRTITPKGNTFEVVRSIELNKQQFTPAEYKELRTLINEWVSPNNSLLLFSAE